jgi:peptide/nickel transport system substrate-binding protein
MRLLRYIIIILFFSFSGAQISPNQGEIGDILKIGYIYKRNLEFNPLKNVFDYEIDFNRLVFGEGLYNKDISGQVEKNLALSSENINNTWLIKIHSTAYFHDGSKITANDVKFSFELYKKFALQLPKLYIARIIKRIVVQSPTEVHIDLYDSDYDLKKTLGLLPILPGKYYKKWMQYSSSVDLPDILPVGAGYFKFGSQANIKSIRLSAHVNHFKKRAYLKEIEIKFFDSVNLLVEAFIKGEVDFIRVHNQSVIQRIHQIIQNDAKKMLIKPELQTLYYIALNTEYPLFSKQKIRQALSYTINREELLDKILEKNGTIADNILKNKSDLYFNSINSYTYNPLKSLEMLKTIGYHKNDNDKLVNGQGELKFELLIEEGSFFHEMIARRISIDLGELGINIIPVPIEAHELQQRISSGRFQAALNHFRYDPALSDQVIRSFYMQALKGSNPFINFKNQQIEQLFQSGEKIFHQNQIRPIMHRIQYLLNDAAPCIYLFFEDRIFCAIDSRFENFRALFFENSRHVQIIFPEYEWYVPKEKQKYR